MARLDASAWEVACADEMGAFEHMGVYEIIPRPEKRKIVGSKWVFWIKRGPDGSVQKYKARIVAQGFSQIEGIDFDETFAPVAKLMSLCTILVLAAEQDLLNSGAARPTSLLRERSNKYLYLRTLSPFSFLNSIRYYTDQRQVLYEHLDYPRIPAYITFPRSMLHSRALLYYRTPIYRTSLHYSYSETPRITCIKSSTCSLE